MTARVVMGQKDRRRIQGQRPLDHNARVHLRPIYCAREQPLDTDELVLGIEKRCLEVLSLLTSQPQPEECTAGGGIPEQLPPLMDPPVKDMQRPGDGSILPSPDSPLGRGHPGNDRCAHA